jgi:rubrerythrin
VAIPLTAEFARAPAPAALGDGDQMLIAELREAEEETEVEGGMVAAEEGRTGKRAEYRCAGCGYGIVVYEQPPGCPVCSETRWEHVEWRPFSQRQPALAAVAG